MGIDQCRQEDLACVVLDPGTGYIPHLRRCAGCNDLLTPNQQDPRPCVHAGGVVVRSQTVASWVAELAPGPVRHWATGTAAPCLSLFKPVSVDQPVYTGRDPDDHDDGESLWWRHEALHRRAHRDPDRLAMRFLDERDATEKRWLAHPPPSDVAFKEADALLERWTRLLSEPALDRRPSRVRRIWSARNARAGVDLGARRN